MSSVTDSVAGLVLTKFNDATLAGGATNTINYGPPNAWYNTNGTSADFLNTIGVNDPGVGLFKTDTGVNTALDLSTLTNLTLEAFVYPYDLRQAVILRKYGGTGVYYIDMRPDGRFGMRLKSSSEDLTDQAECNDLPYTSNRWYHIALVWNGSAVRFYVNGVASADLGASHLASVPFAGPIADSSNGLGVGCIVRDNNNPPTNSGQFFYGRIDEIRISNAALSPSQFLFNATPTNSLPLVQFAAPASAGTESLSPALIPVILSAPQTQTVTVAYAVTDGTATGGGVDYTLADGTVTFNPGVTNQNISITIINDTLVEGNETIALSLSDPVNVALGNVTSYTYTILDDDVTLQKTETFDTATSAAKDGWAELGSRSNGENYGCSASANAGGPPGEAGGSMARKALRSTYCDVFGGPLTLNNYISAKGEFVLTSTPSSGNASVVYGHGDSTQTGLNSEASQMGLVLATSPPRFFAHITFANGSSSRFETVLDSSVTLNQVYNWDYTYDPDANAGAGALTVHTCAAGTSLTNTALLNFTAAQRALGASFDSFGIIQRGLSDMSPAPVATSFIDNVEYTAVTNGSTVQFATAASSALETTGSAGITVVMSQVLTQAVTVQYAITGGSAIGGGVDYTLPNGTLTFPPGVTSMAIPVTIVFDGLDEADETIEVSLANPTGAGLGARAKHVLTIINVNLLALGISNTSAGLAVSWPASFWNYQLQYRPDLVKPPAWSDVTNPAIVSNGWRQVFVTPSAHAGFFRLAMKTGALPSFTNSIGLKLAQIPAGVFTMGYWQSTPLDASITSQGDWVPSSGDYDEKPAHQVTISRPFWMGA